MHGLSEKVRVLRRGAARYVDGDDRYVVRSTVSEVGVISTGNTGNDGILVLGTFSPSLGCPNSGFMLFQSDAYFNQSYALLLAAMVSGAKVRVMDVYCLSNGYARGNGYSIVH